MEFRFFRCLRFTLIVLMILVYTGCSKEVDIVEDEIPASIVYEFDGPSQEIIDDLVKIEAIIKEVSGSESIREINNASMFFLRAKRYGYLSDGMDAQIWANHAGSLAKETLLSVEDYSSEVDKILALVEGMDYLTVPSQGYKIDFPHMIVVADIYYTESGKENYEEPYLDALFSWGSDLETFLIDMNDAYPAGDQASYQTYFEYAISTLASSEYSYFSEEDYYADIDGVNIEQLMSDEGLLLSDAFINYYETGMFIDRENLFLTAHGGQNNFESMVKCFMLGEIPNAQIKDVEFKRFIESIASFKRLMTTMMNNQKSEPSDVARQAAVDAFLAKLMQ